MLISPLPIAFVSQNDLTVNQGGAVYKIRETSGAESRRILEDAKELLGKRFSNIDVVSRVGNPSREMLKTAEMLKANLIAIGCRSLRGIKGIMG